MWHPQHQKLYWVDIEGYAIHIYHPDMKSNAKVSFDAMPSAIVPMEDGNLLVAFENGLALWDTRTGTIVYKQTLEDNNPAHRSNDGKCDPNGNFWIGTMHRNLKDSGRFASSFF